MLSTGSRIPYFSDKNRVFWLIQSLGWLLMTLVALGILRSHGTSLAPFILFRSIFGFLVTAFLLRPILRLLRGRYSATPVLLVSSLIGSVIVFGLADAYGTLWIFNLVSNLQANDATSQMFLNSSLTLRCGIYAFWVSLYLGINHYIDSSREQLRLVQLESDKRDSELRLLRAQVNPHFLFNALNAILAEAENPDRVTKITHSLADYLRFSLEQTADLYPLGDELNALENYLRVEKIRFEERLEYTLEADEAARGRLIPGALIQPLLENAIKYGQRTSPPPLRLAIRVQSHANGALSLVVENSGQWVEPGASNSTSIGLNNLRRRLELDYHGKASLTTEAAAGIVRVRVELPAPI
jgi:sensor histidine kinase YesM